MTETKSPLTSRTFIGLFVAGLFTILGQFDITLPFEQGDLVTVLAQIAGLAVAAYGRVKATKGIALKPGAAAKLAVAFLLVGGIAGAGPLGCASQTALTAEAATPTQRVYALQGDYNAVLSVAATLVDSGQLDDGTVATIRHLDSVAYSALREAQSAVRAKDDPTWPAALAAARQAVEALAAYVDHRRQEK